MASSSASSARSARRPNVWIISPTLRQANSGNWHTAARWARFLRETCRVHVSDRWSGEPCDLMIALHARRSAAAIQAFATARPIAPRVVVLTGTDLYGDIATDADARRSLELATRLVVLQARGRERLSPALRSKAVVICQSAPRLTPGQPRTTTFDVAVVGHLRSVKDPLIAMRAAELLPADSRARILHAGASLDAQLARAAVATTKRCPRYRWLRELPRAQVRQLLRNARLLLHPSTMEGGAQVIIEAIQSGTAVIASRIDGNIGLLGTRYSGYFPVGNAAEAVRLILEAERSPAFHRKLQRECAARAPLFDPARERKMVTSLVDNLLVTNAKKLRR